jgi:pimeloyl-ACP methyl ester carboxylesterase
VIPGSGSSVSPLASVAVTAFTPARRGGSGPPLLCIHGFTDTWRTWELALPMLEERHDVLAPTLPGHAGGPAVADGVSTDDLVDALETAMDEAGFATAHVVGSSLGGYLALRLAARGRARTVVALAPGGGWREGDASAAASHDHFRTTWELLQAAAPHADAIVSTVEGRRKATRFTTVRYQHIPPELLAHQLRGAAACQVPVLLESALREGWPLDAARIECPVRVVWGVDDQLLRWPLAAERYREELLPHADWVALDGVGHLPQLDVPLETAQLILGFTTS